MTASAEKDSRREAGSCSGRSEDSPAEIRTLTEAFTQTAVLMMILGSQEQKFLHFTRPGSSILHVSCKKTQGTKRKLVRLWLNFQNQVLVQELTYESQKLELILGLKSSWFHVNKSSEKTKTSAVWLPVCRSQLHVLLKDVNPEKHLKNILFLSLENRPNDS